MKFAETYKTGGKSANKDYFQKYLKILFLYTTSHCFLYRF